MLIHRQPEDRVIARAVVCWLVLALVAACTHGSTGTVTSAVRPSRGSTSAQSPSEDLDKHLGVLIGRLLLVQPQSGQLLRAAGTVSLRGPADYRVTVKRDGRYEIAMQPGRYRASATISGLAPQLAQTLICRPDDALAISSADTLNANVICDTTAG
jgi:hypothetical protein